MTLLVDRRGFLVLGSLGLISATASDNARRPPAPPPTADDLELAALFAAAPDGGRIKLDRGRHYQLTQSIHHDRSIGVDLNRSRLSGVQELLIISAPRRIVKLSKPFDVIQGSSAVHLPKGVQVQVGDLVRFESDDVRQKRGRYKFGEINQVDRNQSGQLQMRAPLQESYRVDRMSVQKPIWIELLNGELDVVEAKPVTQRGARAVIATVLSGASVLVDSVRAYGGDYAGVGIYADGQEVRLRSVWGEGFLDLGGIPGGGRLGYGMTVLGRDVRVESSGGARCKHVIECASRDYLTASFTMLDVVCSSPGGRQDEMMMTVAGERQPVFQYLVGCHANVTNMRISRAKLDGVNSLIGVRNGNAEVVDSILTTRGVNRSYGGNYLVNIYETPLEKVMLDHPRIVNAQPLGGASGFLVGVQSDAASAAGEISIVNPQQEGGSPIPLRFPEV